jgi:hypothetical protein
LGHGARKATSERLPKLRLRPDERIIRRDLPFLEGAVQQEKMVLCVSYPPDVTPTDCLFDAIKLNRI